LPVASNPIITTISGWFASLLAGAVFVEIIFGWNGMGKLLVEALNTRDLPITMGCVLVIAALFVVLTTLVDVLYAVLDPRIRAEFF
jgi:peptide/nickel transport system permease protein